MQKSCLGFTLRPIWGQGLAAILGIGLLSSCLSLAETSMPSADLGTFQAAVPIAKLQQSPPASGTVTIQGQVRQRIPLLQGWIYAVADDTGQIWVLTQQSTPQIGETAQVTGRLQYEPILVGEADIGEHYVEEKTYRPQPPEN